MHCKNKAHTHSLWLKGLRTTLGFEFKIRLMSNNLEWRYSFFFYVIQWYKGYRHSLSDYAAAVISCLPSLPSHWRSIFLTKHWVMSSLYSRIFHCLLLITRWRLNASFTKGSVARNDRAPLHSWNTQWALLTLALSFLIDCTINCFFPSTRTPW